MGMHALRAEHPRASRRHHGEIRGLDERCRPVVQGGVGDLEAGEPGDHRLILEHRLKHALGHLGLIGRVGGHELRAGRRARARPPGSRGRRRPRRRSRPGRGRTGGCETRGRRGARPRSGSLTPWELEASGQPERRGHLGEQVVEVVEAEEARASRRSRPRYGERTVRSRACPFWRVRAGGTASSRRRRRSRPRYPAAGTAASRPRPALDRHGARSRRRRPCHSGGRNASAIPRCSTGEKLPLVTTPADRTVDEDGILGAGRPAPLGEQASQRADAARRARSASSASRPRNGPLSQLTTHPSPACSGVMPGPSSCPCSGSPASRRSVSRAPRPAGWTPAAITARQNAGATSAARRTRRRPRRCNPCRRHGTWHPPNSKLAHREMPDRRRLGRYGGEPLSCLRSLHGDDRPLARSRPGRRRPRSPCGVGSVRHDVEALFADPPDDEVVERRKHPPRRAGAGTGLVRARSG